MDARDAPAGWQAGRSDAITARLGAAVMPFGVIVIAVSEYFHPAREDPMDNPAVFAEYARSNVWTAVHLGEYFGFLLLLGGLVALCYSLRNGPGVGSALVPFGLAAAVTTAASYTVLQAVDGITLKRAVDAWARAPADQELATFAAAEAVRWTEIGMNSLSNFLTGLTLLLCGVAVALGRAYPGWVGWIAVLSGALFAYHGAVVVAYEGFVPSITKLVALALLAVWSFVMAFFMWRNAGRRGPISRAQATAPGPAWRATRSR